MQYPHGGRSRRTAFLLSQVGSHSAARFAERTRAIGLSPGDAGVLRLLGRSPGMSQRSVAERMGLVPSRVVAVIDSLESRGLVQRERSAVDRRNYELRLTGDGQESLKNLRAVAEAHEGEILAALSPRQTVELESLLALVAKSCGLDTDVHRET